MTIIKTYNLEIIELQIKGLKFMSRRTLGTKSKGPVKPGSWGYGYQIEKRPYDYYWNEEIEMHSEEELPPEERYIVEADNYRTDTGLGESNLLDLNNFNSALEEAKDKDAIITNNDVIQYLKNGQDLTLEEITKYSAILADNDIYINEEEYIVQDYGIIKPNDNIEITNEVLPINGEVLRVLCQSSSSY